MNDRWNNSDLLDPTPIYEPKVQKEMKKRERSGKKGKGPLVAALCVVLIAAAAWFGWQFFAPGGNWEDNYLRPDYLDYDQLVGEEIGQECSEFPVFGSAYRRSEISSVTFLDSLRDQPRDAWDVSLDADGSVMAWVEANGKWYDLYNAGDGGVNGEYACEDLFAGYVNAERISFGDAFHTEGALNMSWMFLGCESLLKLDLSSFDTSQVESMNGMFQQCFSLREMDLSSFDTSEVTNMMYMFSECENLRELSLRHFDTSNVTDMFEMFSWCGRLEELDVSRFDTARVTDMCGMFAGCMELQELEVRNFETSAVTDMMGMFYLCSRLEDLDVSGFDTANVTDMSLMFSGCPAVTIDDVAHFNTARVEYHEEFMDGTGWESLFG